MSYRYPYGNTEQMNLDWFLNQWEKFKADWAEAEAGIDGSLDAEIAKVEAAMTELYAARDAAAASAAAARQSSLDAVAAQVAAGNSKTAAQAAETSARGSQQAAAQSAQEAQASAQGAENSALTASQAANTATQQAAGADAARGAAEDAQAAAALSAGQAGQAATAAADHADDAADSATLAQQAAQDISDSVEQIATNTSDIGVLKESINTLEALEKSRGFTAAQYQAIAASGHADDYLAIGDIIIIPWVDRSPAEPVTYQVPHVVVHFGDVEDENGVIHPNVPWLMWQYAVPSGVQFDHPEAIVATESTFTEGYYYYIKNGDNWEEQTVTYGEAIPSGTTYYHHVRSGMAERLRYGSNDWSQSAMRQWLNSTGGKGEWWTAQHDSDVAPDQAATMAGFLSGYDSEWLAVFKPIKVQTALNTVCDCGETVTTYDTFFLPSLEQMYGAPQASGIEGDYWEYWKEETGLSSPSNGSSSNTNEARQIPSIANLEGGAGTCRLRSAFRYYTSLTWTCNSTGYLTNGTANYAGRALPACVIY